MDEKYGKILTCVRIELVKHLNLEDVLQHMSAASGFDERDKKEIRAKKTRDLQCNTLLKILPRRGHKAFSSFVIALERAQPHLANLWFKAGKWLLFPTPNTVSLNG